eukprot:TRINITY_DN14076_c0_g1_i3.p1 TRINITY_DN14076_c0_g1~~TRINITY_DN14076_c0_g1_i3.p1  ORF type:complete len:727 (-),score=141.38 TRINITY_DN14076_c0_g1_i3:64-2244(-)
MNLQASCLTRGNDGSMHNELKHVLRTTLSVEIRRIGGLLVNDVKEDLVRCVQDILHIKSGHLLVQEPRCNNLDDGKRFDTRKQRKCEKRQFPADAESFTSECLQREEKMIDRSFMPSTSVLRASMKSGVVDAQKRVHFFMANQGDEKVARPTPVPIPRPPPSASALPPLPEPPYPPGVLGLELKDCSDMDCHEVGQFNLGATANADMGSEPQPPLVSKRFRSAAGEGSFSIEQLSKSTSRVTTMTEIDLDRQGDPPPNIRKTCRAEAVRYQDRLAADISEIKTLMTCEMEEKVMAVKGKADIASRFIYAVHCGTFDYFMGIFLTLSAVIIGVETDVMSGDPGSDRPRFFRVMDIVFFFIFWFELIVRLVIYQKFWFRMEGWRWNIFDLIVVASATLDEVAAIVMGGTQAHGEIEKFGFLRMLKFCRIVRLVRMVRLIPELKAMVYLIAASMSSFFWTIALMILMMYLLAIYYTDTAGIMRMQDEGAEAGLKEKWGSIGHSIFSLFQAVTGGDDWINFVSTWETSQTAASTKMVNTLMFCVYIAFAMLVLLNLVTGVFVEGAQRLIRQDRDAEIIKQARKLFAALGGDGENSLTEDAFLDTLDNGRLDDYLAAVDLRRDEAESLFVVLDSDGSGELSLDEFLLGTLRLKGPAKAVDCSIIKHTMRALRQELKHLEEIKELPKMVQQLRSSLQKMQSTLQKVSQQAHMCVVVTNDLRHSLSPVPEVLV